MTIHRSFTAFLGLQKIASGDLATVALAVRERWDGGQMPLVFDDGTARQVELDLRGTAEEVLGRLPVDSVAEAAPVRSGPGRPKLGVVAREVTLLPRHWEWLSSQPGGASVVLRKLVEAARRESAGVDEVREAREAAYRFMHALAGDLPGYEEATRALFSGDRERYAESMVAWPADVRDYAGSLAAAAFSSSTATGRN